MLVEALQHSYECSKPTLTSHDVHGVLRLGCVYRNLKSCPVGRTAAGPKAPYELTFPLDHPKGPARVLKGATAVGDLNENLDQ